MSKHQDLGLTDGKVLAMYRTMVLTRRTEERIWLLQRQGKVAFCITPAGDEALHIGYAAVMRPGVDWLHPHYRGWAALLHLGVPMAEIFYDHFGKAPSIASGGVQMPSHPGYPELRIVSMSSTVGTQGPQACGTALGSLIAGDDELHFCVFGDDTAAKGDIHEAMNFAAIWKLPVIFIVEDNEWGISTPWELSRPFRDLSLRAQGYGMPGVAVNGWDVLAVYEQVLVAFDRARHGGGPTFVVSKVFRFTGHSSNDDDRYRRPKEVLAGREAYDPILFFREYLVGSGVLHDADFQRIEEEVVEVVNAAQAQAEAALYPDPEDLLARVYAPAKEVARV